MIKIDSISFSNYRQYKDFSISFDSAQHNLYVIKAKNGTGKTTFLSGILWCLYGNEHLQNESTALKMINEKVVQNAKNNEEKDVVVIMKVAAEDNYMEIKRTQKYKVKADLFSSTRKVDEVGKSILEITLSTSKDMVNSKTLEGEDAKDLIKQYFDESIYNYFFFDGEKLQSYFDEQNSQMIKNSIFNISQINLLKNAITHVNILSEEWSRKLQKEYNLDPNLYTSKDKKKDMLSARESENETLLEEIKQLEIDIKKYEDILRGYEPVKNKQKEREKLEAQQRNLDIRYQHLIEKRNKFIRTYVQLLNFAPRIKQTKDLILKKKEEGALPPRIDKDTLRDIVNNNIERCPMCNSIVDKNVLIYIESVLEKLEYSQGTGTILNGLLASLENMLEEIEDYENRKREILEEEKYIESENADIEQKLDDIKQFMSSNTFDVGDVDPAKIDLQLTQAKREHKQKNQAYGQSIERIKQLKYEIQQIEEQIKKDEELKVAKNQLSNKVRIYRTVHSCLNSIHERIMKRVKKEIEKSTWETFNAMSWKKNTFSSIIINDNYEVSVINKNGKQMTGSLSGAESMALAYSFTLAIHKASGRNCPLVVDSPLGRVSDDNRKNMAKELLKVSLNKQIIMLFTPDEFSDDVSAVYLNNANIINVALTEDESEIMKAGVDYE